MSWSVQQVYVRDRVLGKVMLVHLPSLSPVHVLYPDVDSQCQRQCSDMNVVALMSHWFNLLEGTVTGYHAV